MTLPPAGNTSTRLKATAIAWAHAFLIGSLGYACALADRLGDALPLMEEALTRGTTFFIDPKQQLIIIMMIQVPFPTVTFYRNTVRYLAYQALSAPD